MSTNRHQGMHRRDFLAASACAVASTVVGPQLLAASGQPKLMVAGFAAADVPAGTGTFAADVIDARRAPASDPGLARHGVRVSSFGLSGGDPRERRAIELLTHYAIDGAQGRSLVPYFAWAAGGANNAPVTFHVPVDEEQRIRFSMTAKMPMTQPIGEASRRGLFARPATTLEPRGIPVELSLRDDGRALPLSRGFYILVPLYDGQAAPHWSSYSLEQVDGGYALLRAGRVAEFEHFVVRIDQAADSTDIA